MPKEGETASLSKTVSQSDIEQFAELVGDRNPVHVDEDFAKKTRFRRTVAHGTGAVSDFCGSLDKAPPSGDYIFESDSQLQVSCVRRRHVDRKSKGHRSAPG